MPVNGVDYRVRTVPVDQAGGILVSIGIREDSILLSRARIPVYILIGSTALLVAAGLGWLLAGPAVRPLRRLTEPLYAPIRRIMPDFGALDLTPMVVIVIVIILRDITKRGSEV